MAPGEKEFDTPVLRGQMQLLSGVKNFNVIKQCKSLQSFMRLQSRTL